jgi:hypothetical protein
MSARDLRIRDEVLYANRHAAINFISRKIGATISIIGSESEKVCSPRVGTGAREI